MPVRRTWIRDASAVSTAIGRTVSPVTDVAAGMSLVVAVMRTVGPVWVAWTSRVWSWR